MARRSLSLDRPAGEVLRITERRLDPGDRAVAFGAVECEAGTPIVSDPVERRGGFGHLKRAVAPLFVVADRGGERLEDWTWERRQVGWILLGLGLGVLGLAAAVLGGAV